MEKFYIRYHIKGGNRVLVKEVENYEMESVMSEVIYDLDHKKRILFKKKSGTICGINIDSISFFEIQTEKEYKMISEFPALGGGGLK